MPFVGVARVSVDFVVRSTLPASVQPMGKTVSCGVRRTILRRCVIRTKADIIQVRAVRCLDVVVGRKGEIFIGLAVLYWNELNV